MVIVHMVELLEEKGKSIFSQRISTTSSSPEYDDDYDAEGERKEGHIGEQEKKVCLKELKLTHKA